MTVDMQFRHRTLPEQLADHVVDLFATGELAAGQRLYENDFCERLNVSRVPIREAFRILGAQGVIRTEPNKGSYLTELGPDDVAELRDIRLSVERIGLRRLVRRVPTEPDIVGVLDQAVDRMRDAAKVADPLTYYRADLAFHADVIALSGSSLLKPLWESLSRSILVLLMREKNEFFDYEAAINDHVLLVSLIRDGKGGALDREIERHITNTYDTRVGRAKLVDAGEKFRGDA